MVGFGSLIIDRPLDRDYPAGATIERVRPAGPDTGITPQKQSQKDANSEDDEPVSGSEDEIEPLLQKEEMVDKKDTTKSIKLLRKESSLAYPNSLTLRKWETQMIQ